MDFKVVGKNIADQVATKHWFFSKLGYVALEQCFYMDTLSETGLIFRKPATDFKEELEVFGTLLKPIQSHNSCPG